MRISYYVLVVLVLQYIHFISLIELLYLLTLSYPTQFFFQFASRILLKHPDHTQSTDQTQARRILQSFTRKPSGSNTSNLAPYNSTMSPSTPQDPSKQAAQCCRIYHILSCGREILTTQPEPCGCSCSKPLNNVAFACRDRAGAMRNVLNHQLTQAEKTQLGWAEKSGDNVQYQFYLFEYITARVAATSTCHTVLSHIEGSRRACFPAKTETISAFGFPPGKHPFIAYNEYVRQHPELFGMPGPSNATNSPTSAGPSNAGNQPDGFGSPNFLESYVIPGPGLAVPGKRPGIENPPDGVPIAKHHKAKIPIIFHPGDGKKHASKHSRGEADEDQYLPYASMGDGDTQSRAKCRTSSAPVNFSEP